MTRIRRGIDEKSVELARHFLSDVEHTEADVQDLADDIQNAVEDFFFCREKP